MGRGSGGAWRDLLQRGVDAVDDRVDGLGELVGYGVATAVEHGLVDAAFEEQAGA